MERRSFGFFTKRSQHYDNLQNSEPSQKQPLKDATNTPSPLKSTSSETPASPSGGREGGSVTSEGGGQTQQPSRSLQCLETLAQKAGITVDDCKYDIANTLLNLDRGHDRQYQDMNDIGKGQNQQNQQMVDANAQAQAAQAAVQQQQLQQQQAQMQQVQAAHDAAQQQAAAQQAAQQVAVQQAQQAAQQAAVQQAAVQQAAAQQAAVQQAAQQAAVQQAAQQAAVQQAAAQQAAQQVAAQQVAVQQAQQQQQQNQGQTMVQSPSPQHMSQVAVVSSGAQCVQGSTNMGPPQQQAVSVQQSQAPVTTSNVQTQPTQLNTANDWSHGRVQVIQQPLQNPTYLQQLYNTQGQLLMPGNIQLHPGISPQQIQVITASKPFQGNQLAPHMLTTAQGKQVLQASQAGNANNITQGIATFPGYTTIPTIPTTQNQQTLVFSQLGVISSQPNILPAHSAPGNTISQQKQQDMHKNTQNFQVMSGQKVMQKVTQNTANGQQQGQCVQVSQAMIGTQPTAQIISPIQNGQPMQFAPWQFSNTIPQVAWTTGGLQSQLLAPNPIFIRGTQPDGTPGMFIQHNPQATTTIQTQHNPGIAPNTMQQMGKPRQAIENIQPKQTTARPLSNILPSNPSNIRPASSVSTQTGGQLQSQVMGGKPGTKVRTKGPAGVRTSPAPNTAQKADAANQTKPQQANMQHQIVAGNKMLVMNTSTGMTMAPGSPMTAEKAQQLAAQNNKALQQQQQAVMLQQQAMQQQQQQQQQTIQQLHFTQQPTGMTISGMQGQQLVSGERPIMPVVSMPAANAQQMQQAISQGMPQTLPLQPNLAVAQQQMTMNMQQIHPQLTSMPPPGTIISQIQPTTTQMNVPASPTQAQVAQPAMGTPPVGISPQQIPMSAPSPASLPQQIKEEVKIETQQVVPMEVQDSVQAADTPVETPKEPPPLSPSQPAPIPGTAPSQPPTNPSSGDNSLPVAATAEEVKERGPPKAMVKPQVLTHVISDFVIQESSEPFPVTRSTILGEIKPSQQANDGDEPPKKKHAGAPNTNIVGMSPRGELAKCENCGQVDLRAKFKKNKRFCSVACSKKYKSGDGKKKWSKDENGEIDGDSAAESSLSPSEAPEQAQDMEDSSASDSTQPKVNPLKWTVNEVCEFIRNLPGCSEYAEDFAIQEIDGQALMLLKEDHLMTAMAMKLGPALKIVAKIDDMRIDKEPPKQ